MNETKESAEESKLKMLSDAVTIADLTKYNIYLLAKSNIFSALCQRYPEAELKEIVELTQTVLIKFHELDHNSQIKE